MIIHLIRGGNNGEMEYYLLDLERTLGLEQPYFWRNNLHGYTKNVKEAGLFSRKVAEAIVKRDFENKTVMIHKNLVKKTMLLVEKQYEGN